MGTVVLDKAFTSATMSKTRAPHNVSVLLVVTEIPVNPLNLITGP